jgi:hypothetical protein
MMTRIEGLGRFHCIALCQHGYIIVPTALDRSWYYLSQNKVAFESTYLAAISGAD